MTFIDATPTLQELGLCKLDATLCHLITSLTHHRNINTLSLTDSWFTADDIKAVADILKNNAVITQLELSSCGIDDDGGALIAEALLHNSRLNTLSMEFNNCGIRTATALRDVINHSASALTSLHLWWNIRDETYVDDCAVIMSDVVDKLSSFATLEDELSVRGMTAICNALVRPDARVHHLVFGLCESEVMSLIFSMLRSNTSIRHIDVHGTIDDDGEHGRLLAEALKCNTTLTNIELGHGDDDISTNIVSHIESALSINQSLLSLTYYGKEVASTSLQLALSKNRCRHQLRSQLSNGAKSNQIEQKES